MPEWFMQLLEEMEKQENFSVGLSRMVQLSGVTQEHLNRVFKRYLDMTPTEFINLKRINHSADLLVKGNTSTLDVCYQCGFNNTSSFYQVFHKTYHCTPREFVRTRKTDQEN